jgi:hypothetical protein
MSGITRTTAFWIVYAAASIAALFVAARLFPLAIPAVNLDVTASRVDVLAKAKEIAAARGFTPRADAAARFDHDGTTQNYVELEGGGKPAFAALTSGNLYSPFRWEVRLFTPGEIEEEVLRFRPDGTPTGFARHVPEAYVHDPASEALSADAARALAESRAQADWGVDLSKYALIEQSQETRKSGRVDHSFVYERPEKLGEATVRLRLVVAGDELIGVIPFVKVPERFERRYVELRSVNNVIAGTALVAGLLLYGIGGVVLGSLWLARRHWLLWRPALAAGACVSALLAASVIANATAGWFGADTTETVTTFWAKQVGMAVALFVFGALGLGAVFMAAESLARRAFPHHPQLWRLWSPDAGASRQVVGRTLGGYLFVPLELALIAAFYYATNRWLGWWQPSEVLTDPNVLGSAIPALPPIANSLQAGMLEECAFRAIPLSLGALIGARFGARGAGIAIALVLQAVIFGCAHANYPGFPAYSRPVELFLPSLVWGLIFLRFGLLPTMLLHGTFDLVLFSIPVFLLDVPGARVQQGLIVLAGAVPLLVVLARLARSRVLQELPAGMFNGAWQPSAPARVFVPPTAHVLAEDRYARAFQRVLPLLALAGVAAFALFASFRADVPSPRLDRAAAVKAAEAALAARGVELGPEWQRLSTLRSAAEDPSVWTMHKFVWREQGPEAYRALIGGALAGPVWDVRFARFTGEVAERAEEWRVSVGPGGEIRTERHTLPESRPGATLSRDAAQAIAEQALRTRFGVDPQALRLVGADETKRPARLDWTFGWADPKIAVGKDGEARYVVAVAGDEVSAFGRYVFVPEAWQRDEQQRVNRAQVTTIAAGLVFVVAGLAGLVIGVIAWTHRHCDVGALWRVLALSMVVTVAAALNNLPSIALSLHTAEPLWSQWLMNGLRLAAGGVVAALLFGLLAGVGAWGARSAPRHALAGRLPSWAAGVAAALVVLGLQSIVTGVGPREAPVWPPLPQAQWLPYAGAALSGLNVIPYIGAALFVIYVVARLTHGFSRREWLGVALIVVLQCASALAQSGGQYAASLAGGVAAGLTSAAVLWWLLRYDLTMVPAYVVTGAIALSLQRAAQMHTPEAWVLLALQAVVAVAMAFVATRYLARRLAVADPLPTAPSSTSG